MCELAELKSLKGGSRVRITLGKRTVDVVCFSYISLFLLCFSECRWRDSGQFTEKLDNPRGRHVCLLNAEVERFACARLRETIRIQEREISG